MVAVSETHLGLPGDVPRPADGEPVDAGSRVVAVAVSPMELLRPGSDLLAAIRGAGYVDLLLVCEDEPVPDPSPVGVLGGGALEFDLDDLDDCSADDPDDTDDVRAAVAELGIDELHVHRLGLRLPLGPAADGDLVAALSELVGFDPEPGVQCLAPVPLPSDPARAAIEGAVWRIAQVYSLPVQRYRCLELSVVDGV